MNKTKVQDSKRARDLGVGVYSQWPEDVHIQVESVLLWECAEDWSIGRRSCRDYFLFWPIRGTCWATVYKEPEVRESRIVDLESPFLCAPEYDHELGRDVSMRETQLQVFVFHFHVRKSSYPLTKAFTLDSFLDLKYAQIERIKWLQLYAEREVVGMLVWQFHIRQFLQLANRAQEFYFGEERDLRFAKVLQAIENNLAYQWGSSELAEIAQVSEVTLRTWFREHFSLSPIAYVNNERVKLAQVLLRKKKSIEEICILLGFSSKSYFHRIFKRRVGQTPQAWLLGAQLDI